jgi:glycine/D-amino acid oxidase-like deaminating enzyme
METKNKKAIIIGAGLFGSMITRYFRDRGIFVTLMDSEDKLAASKCAVGVYKESWTNGYKEQYQVSKQVLNEYNLIEELDFVNLNILLDENSKKSPYEKYLHIKCEEILNIKPDIIGEVVRIDNNVVKYKPKEDDSQTPPKKLDADFVIVAAGYQTERLLLSSGYKDAPLIEKYWGAVLDVNKEIEQCRIMQWAPYRQSIVLKTSDKKFLFGDGTKVKNFESKPEEVERVSARMVQHLQQITMLSDISKITGTREGIRPILPKEDKNNFIRVHDDKLISATGGGKNSSMLCGFIAKTIFELIN